MRRVEDVAATWEPLDRLVAWSGNPRVHDDGSIARLAASIRRAGRDAIWTAPIVAQAVTGRVISGHRRLAAARFLGLDRVPVRYLDVDDAEATRLALAENRLAEDDPYDEALLAEALADLDDEALATTGFSDEEIEEVLRAAEADDGPTPARSARTCPSCSAIDVRGVEPFPAPLTPAPVEPVSRAGEVYQLGPHRLLVADALLPGALDPLLDGREVDAVITDPPYAIYGSSSGVSSSIADDAMVRPFFRAVFSTIRGVVHEWGHVYVFHDWRSAPTLAEASRGILERSNLLVWHKGAFDLGSNWGNNYELLAFFTRVPAEQTMRRGRRPGARQVHRANVLDYPRPRGDDRQHNAAKPVALLRELVTASTDPGDRVLDPFAGSGSTLLACAEEGRVALLVDHAPEWADVIRRRWGAWAMTRGADPGSDALDPGTEFPRPAGDRLPARFSCGACGYEWR